MSDGHDHATKDAESDGNTRLWRHTLALRIKKLGDGYDPKKPVTSAIFAINRLEADLARVTAERDRDYADMRRFQGDVIRLTSELNTVSAERDRLREAYWELRECFRGDPQMNGTTSYFRPDMVRLNQVLNKHNAAIANAGGAA